MRPSLILPLLLAALLAAAPGARAEVVHMKDGRTFEGEITKETSSSIVIRTKVAGIETTLTLRRRDIESIEESAPKSEDDAAPDEQVETPETARPRRQAEPESRPARPTRDARSRSDATMYIEIPIEGTFGEDVLPEGVRDALEYAARRNIEHIVFSINSPGGYVAAADAISNILREHDDTFTYHAVIEDAISAAIWVALMCDTIHMRPGASIGGAVVFSQDSSTGAAEVDAKMNSIIAANLASVAAARGHNPALVRAMILPEKAAYYWTDDDGQVHIVDDRAAAHHSARTLDDDKSVLTLTADEADALGFATIIEGDASDLGEALGFDNWRLRSDYGAAAVKRAQRQAKARGNSQDELVKRLESVYAVLERTIEEANAVAPENVRLRYFGESGLLTGGSQRRWQEATDECIQRWEQVLTGLKELRRISDELEGIGLAAPIEDLELRDIADRAVRRLRELRENRDRRYL